MITSELLRFIKNQLAEGATQESIKSILVANGWQEQDLDEAFAQIAQEQLQRQEEVAKSQKTEISFESGQPKSEIETGTQQQVSQVPELVSFQGSNPALSTQTEQIEEPPGQRSVLEDASIKQLDKDQLSKDDLSKDTSKDTSKGTKDTTVMLQGTTEGLRFRLFRDKEDILRFSVGIFLGMVLGLLLSLGLVFGARIKEFLLKFLGEEEAVISPLPSLSESPLVATSSPSLQTEILSLETYTNTKYGFQMLYPINWQIQEQDLDVFFVSFSDPDIDPARAFQPSIRVTIDAYNKKADIPTLEQKVDEEIEQINKQISEYNLLSKEKIELIDGKEAYLLNLTFPVDSGVLARNMQMIVLGKDAESFIKLSAVAENSSWERYERLFFDVISSFRLI